MARKGLLIRGKNGQYVKNTVANVVKYVYSFLVTKIKTLFRSQK